jgi:hypothetical protein
MKIRRYDPVLYRQLQLCLNGDFVSREGDELTPAMRAGLLRSLDEVQVGERCACGQPDCRSFRIVGATPTRDSRRVRFIVHGELSVVCDTGGALQRVEWLVQAPDPARRCYEVTPDGRIERAICPFPF